MSNFTQFTKGGKPEKQNAPERIPGWQHTQLSIARFAGGCTYNGAQYIIAYNEEGQPLVRIDVIKREATQKKMVASNPQFEQAFMDIFGGAE